MASIGDLVINLGMRTAPLQRDARRATGIVTGFVSKTTSKLAKLATFGLAAQGLKAISGIARKIVSPLKQAFESIDKLAKTGDKLGVSTERLSQLRFAAEQTGVSSGNLDTALQRVTRRIAEAAKGSGTAKSALAELRLSATDLAAKSPDQAMHAIADAMANVEGHSNKVRLAFKLFDTEGVGLVNTLSKGSAGLKAYADQADRLGIPINREDAARIEAANDAVHTMQMAWQGVWQVVATKAAPWVSLIAKRTVAFTQQARPAIGAVVGFLVQGFRVGLAVATTFWKSVSAIFETLTIVAGGTMGTIKDTILNAMIAAEFVFANWQTVGVLAFKSVALGAMTFANDFAHLFTAKIPALLTWFADNWKSVFFTAFDLATTVFINLGKNIRGAMKAIWDFIKSGGTKELKFAWVPLTEGFHNSISKLPDIPKRELGKLEAQLLKDVQRMKSKIGDEFTDFKETRRAEFAGNFPGFELPDFSAALPGTPTTPTAATEPKNAGALTRGTTAAFSAILAATQRGGNTKEDKIETNTAQAAASLKQIAENTATNKLETIDSFG